MSKSHIKVIFCVFIYIHLLLQPVLFINKNKNTCSMPSFPKRRLVMWAAAGLIKSFISFLECRQIVIYSNIILVPFPKKIIF